ncbi:9641_t:CDS:2, partial [Dentiscutata heterogama]
EEKMDEEREEMLENNFKPNSSSPITKTIESQPPIPDDSSSIPLQATTQSPEAGSPLFTNSQRQEIHAHRQESMRALEGISSSRNSPKPLTSGPGDLRRQSSTPGIGSGSSQPNIQGPGDARRFFQSPNPNTPQRNDSYMSEHASRSSTVPPRKNSLMNDHVSRSSTLRTASSSNSNNSIGIQLDARGRVKQDDMAEAYYDNRIPPQNMHYQQQMHPGMPTTHMPTQNQLAMNNSSQDPRVSSSPGSSNNVARNSSTRMRAQYPQQMYPNSGFYNNIPSYDPRQPPPQAYNNSTFAAQRPNGAGIQRMDDGRQVLCLVKALYDYKATSEEEISFLASDVIAVLGTNPDGWWEGELLDDSRKKRGLFPSNYIQFLE